MGWEADIDDPLLRHDIAEAASGIASRRLASAAVLADRLQTLDIRRAEAALRDEQATAAVRLAEQIKQARMRRRWLTGAAASLFCGLLATGVASIWAIQDRNEARRQTKIAVAVNQFLTEDLLGRGNLRSNATTTPWSTT